MNRLIFYGLLLFTLFTFACDEEIDGEVFVDELPIPDPFEVTLNLSLPAYQSIEFQKHLLLDEVGLKGIIVVKAGPGDYRAFERTCPFEPEKECSLIEMNASLLYLACNCGNSFYNLYGYPTNSPSPRKLREYYSSVSGNILYINNTIVRSPNQAL